MKQKKEKISQSEWNAKYKGLEYYPDRVCACGCGGKIKVNAVHEVRGIPNYIHGHNALKKEGICGRVNRILNGQEESPICRCGCGKRIRIKEYHKKLGIPEYYGYHKFIKNLDLHNAVHRIMDKVDPAPICQCGCGKQIELNEYHASHGIPKYYRDHGQIKNKENYDRVKRIMNHEEEAPLCKCGCGKRIPIKKWHRSAGIPEYIHGHNDNGWREGKSHTEEAKEKNRQKHLGINNSNYGKRGFGVGMYGKHHTKGAREKIGLAQRGEKNKNWRGGPTKYSNEFTAMLREDIRDRDIHACQLCYKKESELDRKLDVHHIDYNKKNCDPENLISLCGSCHVKTNNNREYWTPFFQNMIKVIYEEIAYAS